MDLKGMGFEDVERIYLTLRS